MKRLLTALVLIAAVGALVFFGRLWMLSIAGAVVAALAIVEFRAVGTPAAGTRTPPPRTLPLPWIFGATALLFLLSYGRPQENLTGVSLGTLALFTWTAFRAELADVLALTAAGALALVYIAYPLSLLPQIWAAEDGIALLVFLCVCVWSGDIAALYIGRAFGKRRLAPRLSPGKTWAGAVASVVASVVFGVALILWGDHLFAHNAAFTRLHTTAAPWQFAVLAVALNVGAQIGDLAESALKRAAGIKDSGTLLPGHGGLLDRIDALLFAAPVLWYAMALREYFNLGVF